MGLRGGFQNEAQLEVARKCRNHVNSQRDNMLVRVIIANNRNGVLADVSLKQKRLIKVSKWLESN